MARLWNHELVNDLITSSRLQVTPEGLKNYREAHDKDYFGYFEKHQLVGFVNVDFEDDHYYLNQIAVLPQKRRAGIAQQLLQYITKEAQRTGKQTIKLAVQISKLSAIKCFLAFGFEIDSYLIEQDYTPKDLDLATLNMSENVDQQEFLRLVEYNMIYFV